MSQSVGARVNLAGFLLVAGAIAHAATSSASVVRRMASGVQPMQTVAEIFSGIPTWWIPESELGFAFAVLIGLMGVLALRTGRMYERFLKH